MKSEIRRPEGNPKSEGRNPKEIRNPKAEILTWRSQNQREKRATADYAEYAEPGPLSSWVSVYSAYSAVKDCSHFGCNFMGTKQVFQATADLLVNRLSKSL